ncbi:transcription factor BIM2-like [Rutidosis leptorrhynchoides]|uniref:transcription factor BIM2-like n=1 Tax=Rutidosis leptorrhynchoides TaxID=125765 RepID=UPI003A99329A
MRGGGGGAKVNHEDDEYDDDDFASKRNPSSAANNTSTSIQDGKNIDKAYAIRSKHSVTEQRRRSKINERFQVLREIIPHSEQKRDTASFLLEVIEYVQYLQEKVQKYEGSFQGWGSEPMKLMPWRNSHWRAQNLVGPPPQAIKNGSGPGPTTYLAKHDENNLSIAPAMLASAQQVIESDPNRDSSSKAMDHHHPEFANKGLALPMPSMQQANIYAPTQFDGGIVHPQQRPVISDGQSAECQVSGESLNQHEELEIQGGTISISSVYSQGLLNNLTQALETAGVDLSHANVSVQIDLGKRANRGLASGASATKDAENPHLSNQTMTHLRAMSSGEGSDQAHKRLKT